MQTFTTKGATDLLYADDYRSNGCPDVWVLLNESGTIELEATTGDVESALEELELEIDADVIPDDVMTSLIEHLNSARVLDVPV
jgi:DUF4097 and DUF4098 domain-containing protein YvlB